MKDARSLTASQLAALDLMITRAQEKGANMTDKIYYVAESDTVGLIGLHGGLFEFSEHDQPIVAEIRRLARQLEHSVSLGDLINARAEAVRSLSRG
jgi:hypothetical protein